MHLKLRSRLFTNVACVVMLSVTGLVLRTATATTPAPPTNGCSTTTTIDATDPALPITITNSATFTSTITVAGLDPVLWDIDVETFIRHTYCDDLDIFLISPEGTRVTLTTDNGDSRNNIFNGTLWDDDAGDTNGPITEVPLANNVVETPVVPEEAMGAFIGEDPNGVWTLEVTDDANFDTGFIDAWSLIITTIPENPVNQTTDFVNPDINLPIAIPDSTTILSTVDVTGLDTLLCDVNLVTDITHTFAADLDIFLTSPEGTIVTLTTDNGGGNDDVFDGTVWDDDAGDDPTEPEPVTDSSFANNATETPLAPEEALAAFIGEDPNGTWTLSVRDDTNGDTGSLDGWTLELTTCILVDGDGDGVADVCDPCPIDNPDDTDADGVCESEDICPGGDDNVDTDADGVPDFCDVCPGGDDNVDSDGDGVPDFCDVCAGGDDNVDGDGDGVADFCDPCPADDPDDSDGDGVCDSNDVCPGGDDNADADGDGVADFCDPCPADNPDDSDGDGVCDSNDVCPGGNDNVDTDGDGLADFCDPCPDGDPNDSDGDGICDSADVCPGGDDTVDTDGDGEPDACDDTPTGQEVPGEECCAPGTMTMMPFTMLGWSWMRRRRRKVRGLGIRG
ncbi:MAG: proprotein convertase P-domain-containing protein [Phycisphaerales bacterium]|nr:proprotein convertase P-domain-containing protein [Phycisphaerales bacterium]